MALRLGDYVVYGELYNRRNYSTHGQIALRGAAEGEETVVRVELTGNCDADLRGKGFRFMPRDDGDGPIFVEGDFPGFQIQQIGATGSMTAQGWVRALPCDVGEYMRRCELGEPPPTPWKRRLYLEWFSQNGRVVIEMADPIVEECTRQPRNFEDEGEWRELPNLALPPESVIGNPPLGPDITSIRIEGDDVHVEHWRPTGELEGSDDPTAGSLQRQLDAETRAIERSIRDDEPWNDGDDAVAEVELMDYCIDHADDVPLRSFLKGEELPRPEDLDDVAVEAQLKSLLAELALAGVALDVCEHFTPRDCYRLLVDTVLDEGKQFNELVGTGWVTHVSTWEYCAACLSEDGQPAGQ
jgi:hypothetical protein